MNKSEEHEFLIDVISVKLDRDKNGTSYPKVDWNSYLSTQVVCAIINPYYDFIIK